MKEFADPPIASLSVSITPDVMSDAAIWFEDRDTQLLLLLEEVLTTLVRVTVTAGISLLSIVSVSAIAILLTISPYNLLSIRATACACVPDPAGAAMVTVGAEVYPLPPLNPLNTMMSTVTTSPFAIVVSALASTPPCCKLPEIVTVGGEVYPEPPSVKLIVYTTPCLYSVDCRRPPDTLPVKISPIVN